VPRRVLDMKIPNNPDSVQLKTWDHERNPDFEYAALSHCWRPSGFGPTTTTNANIAIRENGIAISDLSKTVQDPVFVARSLGIRYLWVDTLCIIKNDESD
jgi:Heterokaryon incompatibility protein (HET)